MSNKYFKLKVDNLSNEITNIMNEEKINQLAKATGFVKREIKLDGFKFLDMLLFTHFNYKELSLNDLSAQLKLRYNISIRKQSLDERFTESTVIFFKTVLEEIIHKSIQKQNSIAFTKYDKVRIKDSTAFQLPESMQDKYEGSGGKASKAMIRIQFEYDLKNGKILDLKLYPFNNQDSNNAKETINDIDVNDLVIRDLAYISINNLKTIENKSSYYLNRINSTTNIYTKKENGYKEINFHDIQKELKLNNLLRIEKEVYIGEEKFKTRLIIELLPQEQYDSRIMKAQKNARKKGRQLGKNYKTRAGLNLFISNTDIDAKNIRLLYTMRWQIELMFKIWKSIGEIDKVKKMKVERFEACLFAKLIWITLNWQIMWMILIYFYNNSKKLRISPYKMFKTFKMGSFNFRVAMYTGKEQLSGYIKQVAEISLQSHKSEKKKNSKTWSYEIIELFYVKTSLSTV